MLSKKVSDYITSNAVIYDAEELLFSVKISDSHELFDAMYDLAKGTNSSFESQYNIKNLRVCVTDFNIVDDNLVVIFSINQKISKNIGFANFYGDLMITGKFILKSL